MFVVSNILTSILPDSLLDWLWIIYRFAVVNILTLHKYFILTPSWSCMRSITKWTVGNKQLTRTKVLLGAILHHILTRAITGHHNYRVPQFIRSLPLTAPGQNSNYPRVQCNDGRSGDVQITSHCALTSILCFSHLTLHQ